VAAPRKRRRRRIGAAIAIFLAFAIGLGITLGTDSLLWGALAGIGAGGLGWGMGFFWPGGETTLAELEHDEEQARRRDDDDEGLSDDSSLGT